MSSLLVNWLPTFIFICIASLAARFWLHTSIFMYITSYIGLYINKIMMMMKIMVMMEILMMGHAGEGADDRLSSESTHTYRHTHKHTHTQTHTTRTQTQAHARTNTLEAPPRSHGRSHWVPRGSFDPQRFPFFSAGRKPGGTDRGGPTLGLSASAGCI